MFAITSGHKTDLQKIMYLKEKEKKRYISPHYIPQKYKNTPPNKKVLC